MGRCDSPYPVPFTSKIDFDAIEQIDFDAMISHGSDTEINAVEAGSTDAVDLIATHTACDNSEQNAELSDWINDFREFSADQNTVELDSIFAEPPLATLNTASCGAQHDTHLFPQGYSHYNY